MLYTLAPQLKCVLGLDSMSVCGYGEDCMIPNFMYEKKKKPCKIGYTPPRGTDSPPSRPCRKMDLTCWASATAQIYCLCYSMALGCTCTMYIGRVLWSPVTWNGPRQIAQVASDRNGPLKTGPERRGPSPTRPERVRIRAGEGLGALAPANVHVPGLTETRVSLPGRVRAFKVFLPSL